MRFSAGCGRSIAEKVKVVNVEVPVRVFAAGESVGTSKRRISRFGGRQAPGHQRLQIVHKSSLRRLSRRRSEAGSAFRYFVLAFSTYDYDDSLRKGLAFRVRQDIAPQDRLLAFTNEFAKEYKDLLTRKHPSGNRTKFARSVPCRAQSDV